MESLNRLIGANVAGAVYSILHSKSKCRAATMYCTCLHSVSAAQRLRRFRSILFLCLTVKHRGSKNSAQNEYEFQFIYSLWVCMCWQRAVDHCFSVLQRFTNSISSFQLYKLENASFNRMASCES